MKKLKPSKKQKKKIVMKTKDLEIWVSYLIQKKITMSLKNFNNDYMEYEHIRGKDEILTITEYLEMIRLHLSDK